MNNIHLQTQLQPITDITWLIPRPEFPSTESSLVQNVDKFQFMDLLIELTEANLLKDKSLLGNLTDLTVLTDPLTKGLVLAGIGDLHSYFGNYVKSFSAFHRAMQAIRGQSNSEALAFVYSSMNNLLRKLGHREATVVLAEEVLKLTKNEFLYWRARVQQALAGKYNAEWQNTIRDLNQAMRYYQRIHNAFRQARIQRHLAHINAAQNNFAAAERLLDQAEHTAIDEHRLHFLYEVKNDQAYLKFLQKQNKAARSIYLELKNKPMIPYQEALVYQNLGLIETEEKKYSAAIACFRKSLAITKPNDMRELLLEDYLYLARCYQKTGDDVSSYDYYDQVHQTVLADLELGLPLNRPRKVALEETVRFLKAHCRLESENREIFAGMETHTLAEARYMFQQTLLALHLRQTETLNKLSLKLNVTPRSLHGYRSRLGLQRSRDWDQALDNSKLTSYAERFLHFSWKEATAHFEDDFIRFALRKQGFNKRITADHLGISYPQILMKTERKQSRGKSE